MIVNPSVASNNQFVASNHHNICGLRIFLTLLGLGLIKINDVSANFENPRPWLILNN